MSDINEDLLSDSCALPLIISPVSENVDAASFMAERKALIERRLRQYGAILFRGFRVGDVDKFQRFTKALATDFPVFEEESSPRHRIKNEVQTATDYPSDYPIQFHSEYSYSVRWPMKIFFWCRTPAVWGGQTPIADNRKVLRRLSERTREEFRRRSVLYRRRYQKHMGVPWQRAFLTTDRATVEQRCRDLGINAHWDGPDCLATEQLGEAILAHPHTGEEVWFNHAFFFNVHAIEPVTLRDILLSEPEKNLSANTYYGDGGPISAATVEEIRLAYDGASARFDWRQDDILLVDNMLVAHSRAPYRGNRELLTVMADAMTRTPTPGRNHLSPWIT